MSAELYASVGGKLVAHGPSGREWWDFGWVPPEQRSDEQHEADAAALSRMPRFEVFGKGPFEDADKVDLTQLWRHPAVVAALGFPYPGTHQLTGSCVGAGSGNVVASVNFVEVLKFGDPEKVILPFYPYHYGRGRLKSGMGGRGEGSSGSGQAEAIRTDGVLDNLSHPDLPKPTNSDALVWGGSVEMAWSAGGQSPCKDWLDKGRVHPIKTVAPLRSAGDVRQALVNLFPVTCASMYGHTPRIESGVLLGRRGPQWSHQMSIHAWWKHPALGPIYWLHNQWGLDAHGRCPTGMPGGGVWILESDVEWICRTGEVFAFSGMDGYPAPDFDVSWLLP